MILSFHWCLVLFHEIWATSVGYWGWQGKNIHPVYEVLIPTSNATLGPADSSLPSIVYKIKTKSIYMFFPPLFFGHRDFPSSSRLSDSTHARTTSHNSVCRGVRHIRPRALQHIFETLLSWLHTKIMGMGRPSSNPCRCKSVEHPSKKPDIVADNEVL